MSKFDTNKAMDFIFTFVIMLISLVLLIKSPESFNDTIKEILQCILGISSLATLYTGWKLYLSKTD